MVLLYITIAVITLCMILSIIICFMIMKPNTLTYEECLTYEKDHNTFDDTLFPKLKSEDFVLQSRYKYDLNCRWFDNKSDKTVIIVHGYTVNMITSLRYFDMYYNEGFNVLLYDHRYHGTSGGKHLSMGFYEKYDLQSIVSWVKEKVGKKSFTVIHGESMGASTTLEYGALEDRVNCLVVDSPYADLKTQLKSQVKNQIPFLPGWFINVLSFTNKCLFGFTYKQVSPKDIIDRIQSPILYMHGGADSLVVLDNSKKLNDKTMTRSKLVVTEQAEHAMSIIEDKQKYEQIVMDFVLSEYKGDEHNENC